MSQEPLQQQYEILIRSVAKGLREVYASADWAELAPRAQALWTLYAGTTGLTWNDVEDRVRNAWTLALRGDD